MVLFGNFDELFIVNVETLTADNVHHRASVQIVSFSIISGT